MRRHRHLGTNGLLRRPFAPVGNRVHHCDLVGSCNAVKVAARSSDGKSASFNNYLGLRSTHDAAGSGTAGVRQRQNRGIN